ncbi:hypothetical protein [Shewanella waksmanii]|uniref:hypothetical protein n=1 Tax=Shewanella waksmanii TaxID=213783 RepID=UPI00048D3A9D|nr:hypothetical protein [Shewanella waksmanii]
MKHVSFQSLIFGVVMSFDAVAQPEHYSEYELKVSDCIRLEKQKQPVMAVDLKSFKRDEVAESIFYLKEKRIVDCSAHAELISLAHSLQSSSFNIDSLKLQYLSLEMIAKEEKFQRLPLDFRNDFIKAVEGKSLEINLLDLFDEIDDLISK